MLKIEGQRHGAVVRAHDIAVDGGVRQKVFGVFGGEKIEGAPAGVILPRVKAAAMPAVGHGVMIESRESAGGGFPLIIILICC